MRVERQVRITLRPSSGIIHDRGVVLRSEYVLCPFRPCMDQSVGDASDGLLSAVRGCRGRACPTRRVTTIDVASAAPPSALPYRALSEQLLRTRAPESDCSDQTNRRQRRRGTTSNEDVSCHSRRVALVAQGPTSVEWALFGWTADLQHLHQWRTHGGRRIKLGRTAHREPLTPRPRSVWRLGESSIATPCMDLFAHWLWHIRTERPRA